MLKSFNITHVYILFFVTKHLLTYFNVLELPVL